MRIANKLFYNLNIFKSMKIKVLMFVLVSASAFALHAQNDNPELPAIRETLGWYMNSGGDTAVFAKAFLREGQMIYIDKGKTTIVPLRDFIARQKPGGAGFDRQSRIVSIDVHENAASAHLEMITPKFIFNDYMNLLKTENGWKIVSKIFHRTER